MLLSYYRFERTDEQLANELRIIFRDIPSISAYDAEILAYSSVNLPVFLQHPSLSKVISRVIKLPDTNAATLSLLEKWRLSSEALGSDASILCSAN